jgi:NAD(P)-dependent dehydrogenase (short-subunit alcohol dehydrogenase family)
LSRGNASPPQRRALLVGNTDGIGLAMTRRLLAAGWSVTGVSRRESSVENAAYRHRVADVGDGRFSGLVEELAREAPPGLCIYLAGIGEFLDTADMSAEARVFDVNLTGMVRTAAAVVPGMVRRGEGHFIGVSSMADELLSAEAPSYSASKAGFTSYLGGLALALKPRGVRVTNVRFGFVDTKMAKGSFRPLMMSVEKAVDHLETCIRKKPASYTAPLAMVPLVRLRKFMIRTGLR